MYKVCALNDEYPRTQISEAECEDWTDAQDQAVQLLNDGIEYVTVLQWDEDRQTWCLLQELNLERGIMPPSTGWNTNSLAPYYVRLRGL